MEENIGSLEISEINNQFFSSKELTQIVIKVVLKSEDQLFNFAQKYLEYLVHLMHLNKPIDFIQAALVMQTLSSVFAKKVDNLQEQILAFTVIFRKLELGNNMDDENGENNEGPEKNKVKKKNIDKGTIMRSFENVCSANNIRKNFIKTWSDKDIKKVDPYFIRNKINECPKLKTADMFSCYIYDNKLDKLGKKDEFEANGILCNDLIPRENFCIFCTHNQDAWRVNETMNVIVLPINTGPNTSDDPLSTDDNAMDVEADKSLHDNSRHSYQDVVEKFINNKNSVLQHVDYQEIHNRVADNILELSDFYNVLWSRLDDDNKILDRKLQRRNIKIIPRELLEENKDDSVKKYKAPDPSEYVLSDLILAMFKLKSNIPLHSHFLNGLRREKDLRAKNMPKRNNKNIRYRTTEDGNENFRGFAGFGEKVIVNDDNFGHDLDLHPEDNGIEPDINNCMEEAIQKVRELQGLYHNQLDDTVNNIAVKVSAWHDSIRPYLEKEEKRTNFDIHEYGSEILDKFPTTAAKTAKTSIHFSDCVQNQPREEIPRYFLSSLLLANSYNVAISREMEDELAVNDVVLTLLSKVRHHEVLDEGLRKELS